VASLVWFLQSVTSEDEAHSPAEKLSVAKSRGWIVEELLRASPALTDRKLLLHLSHEKLAGMLIDARKRVRRSA
jgi:hypothetical protein